MVGLVVTSAGSAAAKQPTLYSTATGASSWNTDTSTTGYMGSVYVKDTKADSRSVYSDFKTYNTATDNYSVQMRLTNTLGSGNTTKAGTYANTWVYYHKGCTRINIVPDACGSTRYPSH